MDCVRVITGLADSSASVIIFSGIIFAGAVQVAHSGSPHLPSIKQSSHPQRLHLPSVKQSAHPQSLQSHGGTGQVQGNLLQVAQHLQSPSGSPHSSQAGKVHTSQSPHLPSLSAKHSLQPQSLQLHGTGQTHGNLLQVEQHLQLTSTSPQSSQPGKSHTSHSLQFSPKQLSKMSYSPDNSTA
jgi:hypothetical protein